MASYERFIALRYLFSAERRALASAITLISIFGIAIGVAALVITISVMDGAEKYLFGKFFELYPHVRVDSGGEEPLVFPEFIAEKVRAAPGVHAAEIVLTETALFSSPLQASSEVVAGQLVNAENLDASAIYHVELVAGEAPAQPGVHEVLLGAPLAERLGVVPGDTILAIAGLTSTRASRRTSSGKLRVSGIFETGFHSFDSLTAFISNETFADTFGRADEADYLHVILDDPYAVDEVAPPLATLLGPTLAVRSWRATEKGLLFQSIKAQKAALFVILLLIVIVAGLNVVGTLILMIIEKTREVGIMKAMGVPRWAINRIFLRVGLIIGGAGTLVGLGVGLFGCYLLGSVINFEMPPEVYDFDHLPVLVRPATVFAIAACAMLISLFAGFIPARQAAKLDPVEALRHE